MAGFSKIACALAIGAGLTLASTFTLSARAADPVSYEKLSTEKGPALVGLKFLLKITAPADMGGNQERQMEASGLMIESTGLVLCSNQTVGGNQGNLPPGVTIAPTDMKIIIGEDSEGVPAKVIARDSELDLAWIRIDKPSDKGYTSVNLKDAPTVKLGDSLMFLDRMGNYYDRSVYIGELKTSAILKKPRNLIQPAGLVFSLCSPVFTSSGEFVGVTLMQAPSRDEMQGATNQADMMYGRLPKILPAAELSKATTRAIDNAAKEAAESEKAGKEEKKDEKKPEAPKTPEAPKAPEAPKEMPKDAPKK